MHLFLIRHGETEHNIAGLLAGITDSKLTNHGAIQIQRLGTNLVNDRRLRFTNVYSSDLQRAFLTANEICKAQNKVEAGGQPIEVIKLEVLREQDFGSLELVPWTSRKAEDEHNPRIPKPDDPDYRAKETKDSMKDRASAFLDDYIVPSLALEHEEPTRVAVVSHGIFLAHLWRALLSKFSARTVSISPNVATAVSGQPLEHMSWSNTGSLEVDIKIVSPTAEPTFDACTESVRGNSTPLFAQATMVVKAINDKQHLLNLKRARGGIGSATHDQRQQSINSFFKKRKLNSETQKQAETVSAVVSQPSKLE